MWIASLLYHVFTIGIIDGGLIIEVLIKDNNHIVLNYYLYCQISAEVVHQVYVISEVLSETMVHEDGGVNVNYLDCWISASHIVKDFNTQYISIMNKTLGTNHK